jgi:hypothetical protein
VTNRITRGFSRLGIGVAVIVALVGVPVTGLIAQAEYQRTAQFQAMGGKNSIGDAIEVPSWNRRITMTPEAPPPRLSASVSWSPPSWRWPFGFFRSLGWIIAGFARD